MGATTKRMVKVCPCGGATHDGECRWIDCKYEARPLIEIDADTIDAAEACDLSACIRLVAAGVPFSLVCRFCSADGPRTPQAAAAEGWDGVCYSDCMDRNFEGVCPAADCRKEWSKYDGDE